VSYVVDTFLWQLVNWVSLRLPINLVHCKPTPALLSFFHWNYINLLPIDPEAIPDIIISTYGRTHTSDIQFHFTNHINPLTPELNPSAQHCLTRFFTGDFAS
jgi:hypothetical protein